MWQCPAYSSPQEVGMVEPMSGCLALEVGWTRWPEGTALRTCLKVRTVVMATLKLGIHGHLASHRGVPAPSSQCQLPA